MPVERSAGAIIFYKRKDNIEYLLLHYPGLRNNNKDYWDFPKGHLEKKETLLEAAKREVKEETGISDIEFISGFKETISYFFRDSKKNILKFVTFFLGKTKTKKVKISFEHIGYGWFNYKEAFLKLKFKNSRDVLKKANFFLLKLYAKQN